MNIRAYVWNTNFPERTATFKIRHRVQELTHSVLELEALSDCN
jgi:hypothetical protein